ncbi:MAG: protein-L-isoaspartate(D-aspartate) O-methyltransferase [Gammaproteobacteria bacterium]|nr:MAG: protein-L-isoaspartate(D-aspartate) O-methyltransferase [Gammaproteobacteria bacterium]RLA52657.1 MAG: protein-L-isoaspartate(D-aspartate) O-methyltransferase [Gammaproteobacteria bacterium]
MTNSAPLQTKHFDSTNKVDQRIEAALAEVDRNAFISSEEAGLVVGHSIPSTATLRHIFSVVEFPQNPTVLQIGAGLGYVCVVLSRVASKVIAIEKIGSLAAAVVDRAQALRVENIEVRQGDGSLGAPKDAPFDIIVVSTPKIEDKSALCKQLAPGGQLVCIEYAEASLLKLVKYINDSDGNKMRSEHGYVDFVRDKDEILIELGFVTNDILDKARRLSRIKKTTIIDEVRQLINLNDIVLYETLAKQYGVQLGNVEHLLQSVDPSFFDSCSKAFLDHQHLIPLHIENDSLKVATDNPNTSMVEIQQVFPHCKIEKVLVTPTDFHRLWSAIDISLKAHTILAPTSSDDADIKVDVDLMGQQKPELEAHLVTVFEALLLDAVAERASDIHLEQYNGMIRVRLRVDGELRDLSHYNLDSQQLKGLINVIKLRAELNIAERRLPQGGRSRLRVGSSIFDLRIQVQPALHGEHVVIRLLPQNSELISIAKLGLSPAIAENYKRLLRNPAGLVLVVGPTGSGKSTTLYAGLQLLAADGTRKVITVEDPIEYSIDKIQQTRVRPDIGFTFADAMRSFVRQDPDVILVGEIRDRETALEAIRASQTGHVVLTTLHCNDAVDAMQRLYDLDVHPNSLAAELLAVMAQQLAKRICPHCREIAEPEEEILEEVFPDGVPDTFRAYIGKGCDQCGGSGSHGRVAVVEYMSANADLRNAISRQIPVGELRKLALDCGLVTMRDSALDHVIQGNIPLSELPRILPAERMAPEARWQWEETS